MKKILFAIFVGASAFLSLVSCETETETKIIETPRLTLSSSSVTLTAEATSYSINYTVSNPADNATVTLTSDASWVSGFDTSVSGQASFSVSENTSDDLRTATLTLTYTYDDGRVTAMAALVQYGVGTPILVIDPSAIAVDPKGGTYSFYYSLASGTTTGNVQCTTNVDWISEFDYSTNGMVAFSVAQSDVDALRTGTITVTYADLEKEVTVIQDHSERWTLYGTGNYDYYLYFGGTDPNLELYQSDADPDRFKIENWCYGVDFLFTWNQDTGVITIDGGQYIGYDNTYYGPVYIGDFLEDSGYAQFGCTTGYHKDGIFYFPIQYYCDYGMFCYGYETFTLMEASYNVSVDDFVGACSALEASAFSLYLYAEDWVFAASNDSSKGNIMLTTFDSFECEVSPIYGDFDTTSGVITIEPGQYYTDYDLPYDPYTYKMTFETYYGADASFLVFNNGDIWGAFWGEIPGSYMTCDEAPSESSWWDAYDFIYVGKEVALPSSLSTRSASVVHNAEQTLTQTTPFSGDQKIRRIRTQRVKFEKPALMD